MSKLNIVILGIIFGISSASMVLYFIKYQTEKVINPTFVQGLLISILSSLFITVPSAILTSIISYIIQNRQLVGLGIAMFGLSGTIVLVVIHVKENLLLKKYNRQFFGCFTLFLMLAFIGLKIADHLK